MAKNLPWFKFYPRDWMTDEKLRRCSQATRCFWLEAVCHMYLSDTVSLTGSCDELSRILSCTVAEVRVAVSDLKASGAADIDERNFNITLTSRRRVKEMHRKEICANAGNISATRRQKDGQHASVSESDSVSSGIPGNGDARGKGPDDGDLPYTFDASELPDALKTPEFVTAWPLWVAHRARRVSTRLNRRSARMQLKNLGEWGPQRSVAAIEHSVASAYQGIFEPKTAGVAKAAPRVTAETISAIASKNTKGGK
jgi:hypothetical protein